MYIDPYGRRIDYVRLSVTDRCNLRCTYCLPVDGTLYLCLGQEHHYPLRPLLRASATDAELDAALRGALALKPERHEFNERPKHIVRFMPQTGG